MDDEQVDAIREFFNGSSEQSPNEGAASDGQNQAAPDRPSR
jgi:hypothetical protein